MFLNFFNYFIKAAKCKCFRFCFRMRSINSNSLNLENANSASNNFDSNQTDLPKYEDLTPAPLPQTNSIIGQSQIELSVLNTSSNTIINNLNENNSNDNNSLETDLNLPKYAELNLK